MRGYNDWLALPFVVSADLGRTRVYELFPAPSIHAPLLVAGVPPRQYIKRFLNWFLNESEVVEWNEKHLIDFREIFNQIKR